MSSINKNKHFFGGFGIGVSSSTFIPLLVDWPVDSHSLPWNQVDGGKGRACRGANRGDNQAMISRGGSFFLGRQGGDFELLRRHFLLESLENCLERVAFWIVLLLLFAWYMYFKNYIYIYIILFKSREFNLSLEVYNIDSGIAVPFCSIQSSAKTEKNPHLCLTDIM